MNIAEESSTAYLPKQEVLNMFYELIISTYFDTSEELPTFNINFYIFMYNHILKYTLVYILIDLYMPVPLLYNIYKYAYRHTFKKCYTHAEIQKNANK